MTKSKLRRVKPESAPSLPPPTRRGNGGNDDDASFKEKKIQNPQNFKFGVHGVRLKHFEQVVANILPSVEPQYVCMPPLPDTRGTNANNNEDEAVAEWPFNGGKESSSSSSSSSSSLPMVASARVWGDRPGQLSNEKRAKRKEGQIRSMLRCIYPFIPLIRKQHERRSQHQEQKGNFRPLSIVDFGGGSGHLAIPLALLFPDCRVVVVDLNERSIDLLHAKAKNVQREISQQDDNKRQQQKFNAAKKEEEEVLKPLPESTPKYCDPIMEEKIKCDSRFRRCSLANLYSFFGPVQGFEEPFDVALALHLCGEATDVALRKAALKDASAMVVAPCCVGKLSKRVLNPDVYHATGSNYATVSYPQSEIFCQLINGKHETNGGINMSTGNIKAGDDIQAEEDWNALAKAADYSNEEEILTSRNATRRTAKALLEKDRQLFLEENFGYKTALTRMEPLEATPKNDILIAWKMNDSTGNERDSGIARDEENYGVRLDEVFGKADGASQSDIHVAKSHLLLSTVNANSDDTALNAQTIQNSNDWTQDEEMEIQKTIDEFLETTKNAEDALDQVYTFPTRMGGRKRKLIHFVAGKKGLAHWSVGDKDRLKTVAVARRGQRNRKTARPEVDS